MGVDRLHLGTPELVSVRFAVSPGLEVTRAVRRIRSPQQAPLQRALLARLRRGVPAWALGRLGSLIGPRGYVPDLLAQPGAETPDAVAAGLRATPLDLVAAELRTAVAEGRRGVDPRWLADPGLAREEILGAWEAFWEHGMAAEWPRLRAALEADIAQRSAQLAREGLAAVVEGLSPRLRWEGTTLLRLDSRWNLDVDCAGRGLCLSPTVLGWPRGAISTDLPWTPTVYYPSRNATAVPRASGASPAPALMGRTRAAVLEHLRIPARTGDVAAALGISPATASHHLGILEAAGLITTTREGKEAWHARSTAADRLGW